jgi:NAD(P)-dependent dehydrogenase (short-subunit alcohol dehydrogenase family)
MNEAAKTALVTGANSGLGFEAAAQLAERPTRRGRLGRSDPRLPIPRKGRSREGRAGRTYREGPL